MPDVTHHDIALPTPAVAVERRAQGRRFGAALSRSTLMAARRLLHAYRDGWLLEERLAAVACMAADDARARGLPAEQVLIALKRDWAALDEVRRLPAREARALRDRLVTLYVRAYFDRAAGAAAGKADAGARIAA